MHLALLPEGHLQELLPQMVPSRPVKNAPEAGQWISRLGFDWQIWLYNLTKVLEVSRVFDEVDSLS